MGNVLHPIGRVINNIGWGVFSGGLSSALAFIGSVFVARHLTVADYGVLQLATTYFIFLQLFESFVHPNVIRIELIKSESSAENVIRSVNAVILTLYTLCSLVTLGLFLILKNDLYLYVFIMCAGQIFRMNIGISYYFDSRLKAERNQIANLTSVFTGNLYRILASFNGSVLLQTFSILVTNITTFILYNALSGLRVKTLYNFSKIDWKFIKSLVIKSAPLLIVVILTTMIYKVDILVLGHYGLTDQISYYSNAVRFTEPWNFVAGSLVNSFLPNIIASKKISLSKYYRNLRYMFLILITAAFAIATVTSLLAKPLILLSYGAKYAPSIDLLQIRIWSNIFLFCVFGQQIWEIHEGLQKFLITKLGMAVLLNLGLNLILVPQIGALGCAISTVITFSSVSFWFNFLHKKTRLLNREIIKSFGEAPKIFAWFISQIRRHKN